MKSPAYPTRFLACVEGQHQQCRHVDEGGNVAWVCQCDCHPREALLGPAYALFPAPPESVQVIVRADRVIELVGRPGNAHQPLTSTRARP